MPSKFAGVLNKKTPDNVPRETPAAPIPETPALRRGRPPKKVSKWKSDQYRPTNLLVEIDAYNDADAKRRKSRSTEDMSDLVSRLLREYASTP